MVNLDAYFERIGYSGPAAPTLEVLRALQSLHPAAIPFENIDVLMGQGIDLDPVHIDSKLIRSQRGGYCFEQNNLFERVLNALGFETQGVIGRVVWMAAPDAPIPPRTHRAVKVVLDGETWLADVGFGGAVLTAPLRWVMDEVQPTPHEPFRLRAVGDEVMLEIKLEDWTPVYQLARETPAPIDYEVGNWFTSTHPSSKFRQSLMVARTTPEARFALLNNRFTIRMPGQPVQRRDLTVEEMNEALGEIFGLAVDPEWAATLAWIVEKGA
jgi:N-hydroxyarylamine O-acetyltransferase